MVAASSVLLPLYIYPGSETTWKPLYDSATAYPKLNFTVIVNPNSGPGYSPWWPNSDYITNIAKLNSYSNINIVGYVDTAQVNVPGGPRSIDDIETDIRTYANRSTDPTYPNIGVQGIFFDDVTNVYSDAAEKLLEQATSYTKAQSGIETPKTVSHRHGPDHRNENADLADRHQPRLPSQLCHPQCRYLPRF
jgi:hypothetical protein